MPVDFRPDAARPGHVCLRDRTRCVAAPAGCPALRSQRKRDCRFAVRARARREDHAAARRRFGRCRRSGCLWRPAARTALGYRAMTAIGRLLADFSRRRRPLRSLGASGQLGYGIPTPALEAGLAREPDMIGVDMGSIDIGPADLGSGKMAPTRIGAKRDLRKVLRAARRLDIPLIVGSAGSAGARPHLDQTLEIIREIAREEGLVFRLGVVASDIPRTALKQAIAAGRVRPMDTMPPLTAADVDAASNIVGQLGLEAFRRALEADVDVVVLGRACDTGIFASIPSILGFPAGTSMHMAKIIECASLCCTPGGRDSILGILDDSGFELESMA